MYYRKFVCSGILFFVFFSSLFAQWQWQNPVPFGDPIKQVFFVDRLNGWITPQNTTILKTVDGGENWDIIHTAIIFEDIHFVNENLGWGIGREYFEKNKYSIFHTKNGGLTWEMQVSDTTTIRYDIHFSDDKHGWAVGGSHSFKTVLYTKDGGENWNRSSTNDFYLDDYVRGVVFTDSLNGWLLGGYFWALHTTDGGNTWQKDSSMAVIRNLVYTDSLHYWGLYDSRSISLSIDGAKSWQKISFTDTTAEIQANDIFVLDNTHLFIATNLGVYFSNDGGFTWSNISSNKLNGIWVFDNNNGFGVQKGVFQTTNGGFTWQNDRSVNNEYGHQNYAAVDFVNQSTGFIIGNLPRTFQDNFILRTDDGGNSWISQESNTTYGLRNIFMYNEQTGWIVGDDGTILKTINGGELWSSQNSNADMTLYDIQFFNLNNGWAIGGDFNFEHSTVEGVILHTTDGGLNWSDNTPYTVPRLKSVSFVDSLHGWVIGGGGSVWDYGIIMRTQNGGQTWETQRLAYGMELNRVVFTDTLTGWVTGYDPELDTKILHTNDGGVTWSGQLRDVGHIEDLVFVDSIHGWITSSFGGIYHTNNCGNEWRQQTTYTSQYLTGIDFVDDSTGWAIGWNGTILHTKNGGLTSFNRNRDFPANERSFELFPNYPNPFNPSTHIKIHTYKPHSKCKIVIYDVLGRQVETVFDGELKAGNHIFTWNGENSFNNQASSGLYIYHININGYSKSGKMLLIR